MAGGSIRFEDQDLTRLSDKELRKICGNDISMIFQEPMTSLNPVLKVGRQVRETLLVHNPTMSKAEAKQRVVEMFQRVGIPEAEKRYDCYPHELSGGLRQRVMIAMAMVCKPKLLIADEPTTALDVTIEAQILRLMKELRDETGMSVLIITHNMGVVAEICDYVYVMYAGKIMEQAETFELFDHTMHLYQGPAGFHPAHWPERRAAAHHPRCGAQPAAPATGLPVQQPLRICHRPMPHGKSAAASRCTGSSGALLPL